MTTTPVVTITEELLAELLLSLAPSIPAALSELLRLREEKAELLRVVKDVKWRVADTTDQLQAYGHNGDRLYGLDEWSVPIRNLTLAIGILDKAATQQ